MDSGAALFEGSVLSSPTGAPRPGEVDVWLASARLGTEEVAAIVAGLDRIARDRVARFARPQDRARSAVGRDLLGRVVGAALGVPPARIGVERRCLVCGDDGHGKPRPTLDGELVPLEINLSHAADLVAFAIAPAGTPLGIDVEHRREGVDWASLKRAVFTPSEWDLTSAQPDPERARWQGWSRKEAVVKASGHGLAVSLSKVEIAVVPERGWHRAAHPDESGPTEGWVLDMSVPPGYVGALSVLTPEPPRVSVFCDRGPHQALLADADGFPPKPDLTL